jgi:hypothetical protein
LIRVKRAESAAPPTMMGHRTPAVFKSCAVVTIIWADLTSSPESPIACG